MEYSKFRFIKRVALLFILSSTYIASALNAGTLGGEPADFGNPGPTYTISSAGTHTVTGTLGPTPTDGQDKFSVTIGTGYRITSLTYSGPTTNYYGDPLSHSLSGCGASLTASDIDYTFTTNNYACTLSVLLTTDIHATTDAWTVTLNTEVIPNDAPTNISLSKTNTSLVLDPDWGFYYDTGIQVSGTDPDGDSLTYSLVANGASANGSCGASGDDDNAQFDFDWDDSSYLVANSNLTLGNYNICLEAKDPYGVSFQKTFVVTVQSPNTAPAVSGTSSGQAVNDTGTISPFTAVTITDADNDNVTVVVQIDSLAKGTFTAASLSSSGFIHQGNGQYDLASTDASSAQTAIRQLVFDPTENSVAPGSTQTTTFHITVQDGTDTTSNSSTTVISTSINDAPVINSNGGGTTASVSIYENITTVTTVTATDLDTGDTKSFGISGGADSTKFSINASTGVLIFVSAPDYENPTDVGDTAANNTYVVEVQVSDGDVNDTQTITVTVMNDAAEAPTVTLSSNNSSLAENAGTATLTATLSEAVSESTTVTIGRKSTSQALLGNDFTLSSTSITISAGSTTGTATLTGVDDLIDDDNESIIIEITAVSGGESAVESGTQEQTVTITDDDTAGITLSKTTVTVAETGTTDTFTVKLDTQPTANVEVVISSSATDEALVSPSSIIFSDLNWSTPQTIIVSGVDDEIVDSSQNANISVAIGTTTDTPYSNLSSKTVIATTTDNDTASYSISKTTSTVSEDGTTDTFTVVLNKAPTTDVVFNVISSDTGEATVSPSSLIFTTGNYSTPQTVTLTGVDDLISDGNISSTVTVSIDALNSNDSFDALANQTVSVITLDNDDQAPIAYNMAATVGPNSVNTFDNFTPSYSDGDGDLANALRIETAPSVGTFEDFNRSGDNNWTVITSYPLIVDITELANYRFNAGDNSGLSADVNWSIRTNSLWSNTATGVVTIMDTALNSAPDVNLSVSGTVTINEDTSTSPIYISFSDDYTPSKFLVGVVDSNDSTKVSSNEFTITRLSDNNVSIVITPQANVYGDINITLGAFDGDKNSTKSFILHISSVNDIPEAFDINTTINEDTNYSFADVNVTTLYSDSNDSSEDTNETYPDFINIVTLPAHGMLHLGNEQALQIDTNLTIAEFASLVYTPQENNNTDVSFQWKAYDGEDWTALKNVTIQITPVDDAPVLDVIASQVLDEDFNEFNLSLTSSDVENDPISYVVASSDPSVITVTIVNGELIITPVTDAYGTVTIEVNATANGLVDTQTFDLSVNGVNDTPSFVTDLSNIVINEDSGVYSFELNTTDVEGDELNVTISTSDSSKLLVSQAWNGLLTQGEWANIPLDFNLTTQANAEGAVTITIQIEDENGAINSNNYTISITPINDAPVLTTTSNIIVYKNSDDKNITITASDVDDTNLTYSAQADDSSLLNTLAFTGNVLTMKPQDIAVGSTDINITVSDGEYNDSKIFTYTIVALEDGDDTERVGDINQTVEGNTTTTSLYISNELIVEKKEDTNGTVEHKVVVAGKEIKAISEINGSIVEFTNNGVHTTFDDTNKSIEVNATITGQATHTLTQNGKTTEAVSDFVGAQTRIKDDNGSVEIETVVGIDTNTTVTILATEDGSAEHIVVVGTKTSKANTPLPGATTWVTNSGEVQTRAGEDFSQAGYTIRALVITKPNGQTITKFIKIDNSAPGNIDVLGNTVRESTPFAAGNEVTIDEIDGILYIKVTSQIENSIVIE